MQNINRAMLLAGAERLTDRGFEVDILDDSTQQLDVVDDDGALHVAADGVRLAIYIGDDLTPAQYNRERRLALGILGL